MFAHHLRRNLTATLLTVALLVAAVPTAGAFPLRPIEKPVAAAAPGPPPGLLKCFLVWLEDLWAATTTGTTDEGPAVDPDGHTGK